MPDFQIEIHCPHCQEPMHVMLGQIKREEKVPCVHCKKIIEMRPDPKPTPEEEAAYKKTMEALKQRLATKDKSK